MYIFFIVVIVLGQEGTLTVNIMAEYDHLSLKVLLYTGQPVPLLSLVRWRRWMKSVLYMSGPPLVLVTAL